MFARATDRNGKCWYMSSLTSIIGRDLVVIHGYENDESSSKKHIIKFIKTLLMSSNSCVFHDTWLVWCRSTNCIIITRWHTWLVWSRSTNCIIIIIIHVQQETTTSHLNWLRLLFLSGSSFCVRIRCDTHQRHSCDACVGFARLTACGYCSWRLTTRRCSAGHVT